MAKKKRRKIKVKTLNQMFVEHFGVTRQTVTRALTGETDGPDAQVMTRTYRAIEELISKA